MMNGIHPMLKERHNWGTVIMESFKNWAVTKKGGILHKINVMENQESIFCVAYISINIKTSMKCFA